MLRGVLVSMLPPYYVWLFFNLTFLDAVFLDSESFVGFTNGSTSLVSEPGLLISVTPILICYLLIRSLIPGCGESFPVLVMLPKIESQTANPDKPGSYD
jgi:hypothetical protein